MSITPHVRRELFDYDLIPEQSLETITMYVEDGVHPGGFFEALLSNDLRGAVERADDSHIGIIPTLLYYLFNRTPLGCWGSPEKFHDWIRQGGNRQL